MGDRADAKKAAMVEALRGARPPSVVPPGLDARVDARVVARPQTQRPKRPNVVIGVRG